jgi:transposase InsO family protein
MACRRPKLHGERAEAELVTAHPYAEWTAQQVVEAFGVDGIYKMLIRYYNHDRPHMSLEGDAPARRELEPPENGDVVARPRLGGLHHRYARRAA